MRGESASKRSIGRLQQDLGANEANFATSRPKMKSILVSPDSNDKMFLAHCEERGEKTQDKKQMAL